MAGISSGEWNTYEITVAFLHQKEIMAVAIDETPSFRENVWNNDKFSAVPEIDSGGQ